MDFWLGYITGGVGATTCSQPFRRAVVTYVSGQDPNKWRALGDDFTTFLDDFGSVAIESRFALSGQDNYT
jgi:hypothetical protein